MVAPHKDFPSDNLMSGPVMDGGVPGERLTAFGTLEVAVGVILHNHVGIALNE
ncbi:MAG: hypothetical protein HYR90_04000 [Candidatus Andersenbacteria bacterium]|nr:hypothetical protein [Candidatus Andersenbacteria bacterium]